MANSALGTLLATRLDAVLGTTLAQHPVLLTGAKSHNVAQATSAVHPQDSVIQRGSGQAAEVGARQGQPGAAGVARGGASAAALPHARGELPGGIQPSARAILSEPARTILALLLSRGDAGAGVQGRLPLWDASAAGSGSPATGSAAGASQPSPAAAQSTSPPLHAGQPTSAAQANAAARLAAMSAGLSGRPSAAAHAGAVDGVEGAQLKAPEGMARLLAQSLGQAVAHSGLFYESHLAQMVFGKRGLAELLKEPQAMLARPGGAQSGSAASADSAAVGGAGSAPGAAGGTAAYSSTGTYASQGTGAGASAAGGLGLAGASDASASALGTNPSSLHAQLPVPGVHPDAAPLVRQQLETLANNAFHWQGEAWPGTAMQWEVNEDASRHGADEPSTWATRLALQLPSLGDVEARISLAGERLVVRLVAPDSASRLREHASTLRENLLAGGLVLTDLAVLAQSAAEPGNVDGPSVESAGLGGNAAGSAGLDSSDTSGDGDLLAGPGSPADKGSQP